MTMEYPTSNMDITGDGLSLEGKQYVTFSLEDEEYGMDILRVQEIIGYKGFTKIPDVADYVKGVLNLRGTVVPVIDLRLKFNMPAKPYDKFTVIMIVVVEGRVMGIIVDAVSDVVNLGQNDIQPTPKIAAKIRTEFIKGMGRMEEDFIILLDIEKVLSLEELDEIDSAVN